MKKSTNLHSIQLEMLRNSKYSQASMENLGMKWYKFNIYFRMILSVIKILGEISNTSTDNLGVYIYVLIIDSAIITWTLFTRHWLVHFKNKGVINYFALQFGLPIFNLLVSLLSLSNGNAEPFISSLSLVIAYAIIFIPEFIYWKKRIHLFDKVVPYINPEQKNTDGSIKVQFCRKCGCGLVGDSKFCHKCGNEVIQEKYVVCIFDAENKTLKKEMREVDKTKFPPLKYAVNDTYYAIEKIRDGKKVRIYYEKNNWDKQIENIL